MKQLLIAPDSFEFSYPANKINTTSRAINDVLTELKTKEEVQVLIIPAEQTINSCANTNFSGIELIKHIRLTPDLKAINKLPIVLLHWHDIDYYIRKDQENLFLYSPGIYKYRLPHCKIDFDNLVKFKLNESLTPYLFGSENDESISDHVFKNEIAIKQFEQQVNNPVVELFDKELWFKKIFYKNFGNKEWNYSDKVEPITVPIKILFADDMADKWKIPLKRILPNATFTFANKEDEIISILTDATKDKDTRIENFEREVKLFQKLQEAATIDSEAYSVTKTASDTLIRQINTLKSKIESQEKEIKTQETAFKNLVNRLNANGGLTELLLGDNIDSESLTDQNKKDAQDFSESIKKIISFRSDYINSKNQLSTQEDALARKNAELPIADTQKTASIKEKQKKSSEIEYLFSDLFKSEFDLILLDVHFSQDNQSTSLKESVGYKVLLKLKKDGFKIPVILFSASQQNIEQDFNYNSFSLHWFRKGITPVLEFRQQILSSYYNIKINKQIEVVDRLIQYSQYYIRSYEYLDCPNYTISLMKSDDVRKTREALQAISTQLSMLTRTERDTENPQKEILINIIRSLGNIQEIRIKFNRYYSNNQMESPWHRQNLDKNKISTEEVLIKNYRNTASHSGSQSKEWKDGLNIDLIIKMIATTYKRIMLG